LLLRLMGRRMACVLQRSIHLPLIYLLGRSSLRANLKILYFVIISIAEHVCCAQ
jgi:hypothetical protein